MGGSKARAVEGERERTRQMSRDTEQERPSGGRGSRLEPPLCVLAMSELVEADKRLTKVTPLRASETGCGPSGPHVVLQTTSVSV